MDRGIRIMAQRLKSETYTINKVYKDLYKHDMFFVNRKYQRKLVWTLEEKQALIDTLFQEYPVPMFLIACDYQNGKYGKRNRIGAEELIQFCDGDVLIMPDLHLQNVITKQNYLTRLIDRGVKVYTLLHDLIPVNFPEFYSLAFSREFEEYLMAIKE